MVILIAIAAGIMTNIATNYQQNTVSAAIAAVFCTNFNFRIHF